MKRIIALIGLTLVIGALTAASAMACVPVVGVWAPNGHGNNPPQTFIHCLKGSPGNFKAAETPSPAINPGCLD